MPDDFDWQPIDRHHHLQARYDVDSFGNPKTECDPTWLWISGTEIPVSEYRYWADTRVHIQLNEPDAPDANPRQAVDINRMAPVGPRQRAAPAPISNRLPEDDF